MKICFNFSLLLLSVIAISSCSNQKDVNADKMFRLGNTELLNASNLIKRENEKVYREFLQKIEDPVTQEKAMYLHQKVLKIKEISYQLIAFIE